MDALKHFDDYNSCLGSLHLGPDVRIAAVHTDGLNLEWAAGTPASSGYWFFKEPHDIDFLLIFLVAPKQPTKLWFGKVAKISGKTSTESGKMSYRFYLQDAELLGVTTHLWKSFTANGQSDGTRILQNGTKSVADDAKIPPVGNPNPLTASVTRDVWQRCEEVRNWALKRARGKCQGCDNESLPLYMDDGEVFLEVHHVRFLRDGGPDTPENTVALCPRCHKLAHYGHDRDAFRESLFRRLSFLTR